MASPTTPDGLGRLVAARELKMLASALAEKGAATASGLWGSSVAAVVAAVENALHRPVVIVCGHLDEADDLADDIELFLKRRPDVLPALELGGSLGQLSEEQVLDLIAYIKSLNPNAAPKQQPEQSVPTGRQP